MSKNILIVFTLLMGSLYSISLKGSNDSIIKTKKYFVQQELLCPLLYQLANKTTSQFVTIDSWKFFTGGLKYRISNNKFIGINYLFSKKVIYSKNQTSSNNIYDAQSSIAFNDIYYYSKKHSYNQFYIWLSYYQTIKRFYFDIGLGGGTKKYINNNSNMQVKEVNKNWCISIDAGYNIKIFKNISLNPNIGIINTFSFAKSVNYSNSNYSTKSISDYVQSYSPDLNKINSTVNSINSSYKYFGLYQYSFFLKGGISLQYSF